MGNGLSPWINSFGLLLDIVGAILIFQFGLPEPISRRGAQYLITEQSDEGERKKASRFDLLSKVGLGLLVTGFVFQLVSDFV